MNLQDVRAAAERQRPTLGRVCDSGTMSNYILSTIPPDAEQPVTAEWLREVWGAECEYYDEQEYYWLTVGTGDCCLNVELDDGIRVYLYDAGSERIVTELPHVTTRNHYSQLATALGITPRATKEG